jgi:hypothetical protein
MRIDLLKKKLVKISLQIIYQKPFFSRRFSNLQPQIFFEDEHRGN